MESRFRFLRSSWADNAPWILSPDVTDDEALQRGYVLAGQTRDATALTSAERDELHQLLKRRNLSKVDDYRKERLLERCGFTHRFGVVDFDVNTASPDYDEEATRKKSLAAAQKFAYHAKAFGFGTPNWYRTNNRGGYHADLIAPPDIADSDLLAAVLLMVEKCADKLEIPRLRQLPKFRRDRIDAYLDDTPLNRSPEAKGSIWRLAGTSKPGGEKKVLIDILAPGCPEIKSNDLWEPIDRDALLNALREVKERNFKQEFVTEPEPTVIDLVETPTTLSERDLTFLYEHHELLDIWNARNRNDCSKRDLDMFRYAKHYGADINLAWTLVKSMPGSKAARDHRTNGYLSSLERSARKFPVFTSSYYADYLKPIKLSPAERGVVYKASSLAEDLTIKNNLAAALMCGQLVQHCELGSNGIISVAKTHRCERPGCPTCALSRIFFQLEFISTHWPKKVSYITINLDDKSASAPQAAYKAFKKAASKTLGKETAKKLVARLLTFRAPGKLMIVAPKKDHKKLSAVLKDTMLVPVAECIADLKKVLYLRFHHIMELVRSGSVQKLAKDAWVGKVVTVIGGRKHRKRLPWLTTRDIREDAKSRAKKARGEVDPMNATFHLVNTETGKIVASRPYTPFRRLETAYLSKTELSRNELHNQKPPD